MGNTKAVRPSLVRREIAEEQARREDLQRMLKHREEQTERAGPTVQPADAAETANPGIEQSGILANDHDVDKLNEDIQKLAQGLAERGVVVNLGNVDLNNLRARVEAEAACRMLVAKGIATPTEMAAVSNQVMRDLLMMVLQAVEEMRLRATSPQIARGQDGVLAPPGRGGLAVVKR